MWLFSAKAVGCRSDEGYNLHQISGHKVNMGGNASRKFGEAATLKLICASSPLLTQKSSLNPPQRLPVFVGIVLTFQQAKLKPFGAKVTHRYTHSKHR